MRRKYTPAPIARTGTRYVTRAHPSFDAAYSGKNSLKAAAESATSVVMDLSAELGLWEGATLTLAPEGSRWE